MNTNNGWLDIASAPKDFSTEFDGWNGERVPNVIWAHPEYGLKGEYAWCRSVYEPHHGWSMERVKGLTHWMPLPAAPGSPASTVADEGAKDETPAAWLLTNTRLGKTWASIVSPVPGEIEALGNGGITAEPLYRRPALAAGDARAVAALAELVACDNIKKQIASMQVCVLETDDDVRELDALMSDLARRQPAAWDAARSALAASQQGGE